MTASSFAHALFRSYALKPGKIFFVSHQSNARQTSKHALEWLAFASHDAERLLGTALTDEARQTTAGVYTVNRHKWGKGHVMQAQGAHLHCETTS